MDIVVGGSAERVKARPQQKLKPFIYVPISRKKRLCPTSFNHAVIICLSVSNSARPQQKSELINSITYPEDS
jgi:hypothetical protein